MSVENLISQLRDAAKFTLADTLYSQAADKLEDLAAELKQFRSGRIAYRVEDEWGGYWQTAVDGKPYNFRQGSAEKTAFAAVRDEVREECAKIAECHFDDRGNGRSGHHSEMDWTDGYRDATKGSAAAIRARKETGE